jgi:hypothetical protein
VIGWISIAQIFAMDGKKISFMPYVLQINRVKIAFGKREIINGVQKICFACTVITNETIDLLRKFQAGFFVILKIGDREFLQIHIQLLVK